MSRADDIRAARASLAGGTLIDLTPNGPLTASNLVGDWVQCLGRPGFVEVILSDTVNPAADVVLEASNLGLDGGEQIWQPGPISGAKTVKGSIVFAGPVKVRLRVLEGTISGVDAGVYGTIAWS